MFKKSLAIILIFCAVFGITYTGIEYVLTDTFSELTEKVYTLSGYFIPDQATVENPVYLQNGALGYNRYDTDVAWKIRRDLGLTGEYQIYPRIYKVIYKEGNILNRRTIERECFKIVSPNGDMNYYALNSAEVFPLGNNEFIRIRVGKKFGLKMFYKSLDDTLSFIYIGGIDDAEQKETVVEWSNQNWDG